ncbi:MAG: DUF2783 domain-containing protein [Limnohabitans sp.]|nr:DUF2783 domain-containing protein [Limnohabitans sp.]
MPKELELKPNFHASGKLPMGAYEPGDEFYECLLDAHEGLSEEQSQTFNARLILVLANHIGDLSVLKQAIAVSRDDLLNSKT